MGIKTLKVVPLTFGSILISPPCDSMMRLTIAKPIPVPPGLLELSRDVNACLCEDILIFNFR